MPATSRARRTLNWIIHRSLILWFALVLTGLGFYFLSTGCAVTTRVTPASTAIQQETESAQKVTTTKRVVGYTQEGNPLTEETTITEPGVVKSRVTGTATGAGAQATGDKLDQKIESSAPMLNLPGIGEGSGGSVSGDVTASIAGISVFIILGAFCILGGIACLALQLYTRPAIGLMALGGAFIAVGLFPWLWWLLLVAGVAGLVLYIWAERNHKSMREAVRAVAAGISDLPGDLQNAAKDAIGRHADARDKAAIKSIKRADDLT